jgi:hypothetical protein
VEEIKLSIRLRGRAGVAKKIYNNIEKFKFELISSDQMDEGVNYKFAISYEDITGNIVIHEKGCNQILDVELTLDHWGLSLRLEDDETLYALADKILMDQGLQV